jgi:hypothetical protein
LRDGEFAAEQNNTVTPDSTRASKPSRIRQTAAVPDATFDFVCSNQGFEHNADLGLTAADLARVTKPFPLRSASSRATSGFRSSTGYQYGSSILTGQSA